MARLSRGKRGLVAIIVGAPIAAAILLAGQSQAFAADYFSSCPSSGYTCFYGDINWLPWNHYHDIIGLQGTNPNWADIGDSSYQGEACGGGNWNDCASSDRNQFDIKDMWVWRDINCQNGYLDLPHGVDFSNFTHKYFSNGGDINDRVSSDKMSSGSGC
jgi:hypothetical protein